MTSQPCSWAPPPGTPVAVAGELHVWRVSLLVDGERVQALAASLSPAEQIRAERFHAQRDRRRFIAAHGALRAILGRYLALSPEELEFAEGPHGKPRLHGQAVHFNLAHSDELALVGVASERDVGVDVEAVRRLQEGEEVERLVLSRQERWALHALGAEERLAAFFRCWTRKEAYLKARGDGILREPTGVTVIGSGGLLDAGGWFLADIDPAPGYAGAVAARGDVCRVMCWDAGGLSRARRRPR